ncbi:hypothetical protein PVAP13_3NG114001 [Panicum virgatum]|uniref:Uncharacterized protein n=1 Tax=Panicum virgatum TaxID=38727 RepID=A0A8T0R0J9_PANVG|nr:hypothetical protein PVAP13_6NG216903 [Panicum virgatum]KAG2620256.1 hypothetical protein PVAP13_3NG114001 [Panicum virgatum]
MDLHRRIVLPVCRGPCFHRLRRPRPRPPRCLLPLPWRRPPPRLRRRAPRRRPPPGEGAGRPLPRNPRAGGRRQATLRPCPRSLPRRRTPFEHSAIRSHHTNPSSIDAPTASELLNSNWC